MMKFGKLPAKVDGRTLRLESYLAADALPAMPAARDWTHGIDHYDDDPLGNDVVGDCAYAAPGHAITLASQLAGLPSPVTASGILAEYSKGTGYDPADPSTDRGAYLLDVLKQWRNDGICGVKIEAFVSVAPENFDTAAAMFGGLIVGYSMPSTIWDQDIWDDVGAPGDAGGHAVYVHAVSPGLDVGDSWGLRKASTRRFRLRYSDEAYAVLMADRPAPSGLLLPALRADLGRLG